METKVPFITIQGKASRSLMPEMTIVSVTFKHTYDEYLDACAALESNQKAIFAVAQTCHLERDSISTASYSITKDEVMLKDRNQNYTGSKLLGYVLSQNVSITFDIDNRLLTDLLNGIIAQNPETEISISYALDDTTTIEDDLLAEAVADARRQANAMSAAAGCKLGRVLEMSNGNSPSEIRRLLKGKAVTLHSYRLNPARAMAFEEPLEDNPSLITLSQSVTVVWELIE